MAEHSADLDFPVYWSLFDAKLGDENAKAEGTFVYTHPLAAKAIGAARMEGSDPLAVAEFFQIVLRDYALLEQARSEL